MVIERNRKNPLIIPADVKPSREDFSVECVFNAGVTRYNDDIILLLRVAERPIQTDESKVTVPIIKEVNGKFELQLISFDKNDSSCDFSDSRLIKKNDEMYLTSMSHIRIAKSKDGINFDIDETPFIFPQTQYEEFGVEDPRVTFIDGEYYINYSAVSSKGIATNLVKTKDFKNVEQEGIIFPVENRDVCIYPEKINGKYYALHRPVPSMIGNPEMWIASSEDLIHWGRHEFLMGTKKEGWESGRIGGGAVPFKTEKGWIEIYHGADKNNRYCLGALLLDLDDPTKIIARSEKPILEPEAKYEVEGFFGNVVFSCGVLCENECVKIYYGASDEVIALAEISIEEIYKLLNV